MANKKKRSSKKSDPKANTNKKELTEKQKKFKKQTAAIVGFAIGVLLFFISILDLGSGWSAVRDCLFGMFGWCGFLIAPIIIYISVIAAFDRPGASVGLRTLGGVALVLLLCALTQSFSPVDITQTNFADTFKVLFTSGVELKSGGVAAVLIGWPLIKFCTKVGAMIILIILVFALILIITGTTLSDFLRKASKPVQKLQTEYKEFAEKRLISECHSKCHRYPVIKKWFLEKYPEVAQFGMPTVAEDTSDTQNSKVVPMPQKNEELDQVSSF